MALSLGFSVIAEASGSAAAVGAGLPKAEISYADLDLARADHANELYTRIERAARNVCEVNYGSRTLALLLERQCAAKSVDDAVRGVDNPNLTAVYQAKTGKRSVVASSR
jgi:UrcA family protein